MSFPRLVDYGSDGEESGDETGNADLAVEQLRWNAAIGFNYYFLLDDAETRHRTTYAYNW